MPRPSKSVHPIIRQIIDRDCHVADSDQMVLEHVIQKLKHGRDTFRLMTTKDQESFALQCLIQHRNNQNLYQEVMNGVKATRRNSDDLLVLAKSLVATVLQAEVSSQSKQCPE